MRKIGPCSFAIFFSCVLAGCMTGPTMFERADSNSPYVPGSAEWWNEKALLPPGVRQKCYKGKTWPVRHRPDVEPQQFTHTYHSAHYWPLPYVCQDRAFVRDIFELQTSIGWQEETTIYNRHFDETSQKLSVPGTLHLEQILHVAPAPRRTVFVQSSRDPQIDDLRIQSVTDAIAELTGGTEIVPVALRVTREYSRPASEVHSINVLYNNSVPSPRLGGSAAGGGGAASGGGGAAAAPASTP